MIKRVTLLNRLSIIGAIVMLLMQGRVRGQSIKYLGIEDGLSNNAVTCIYKDHYGFMWMGTYDGLNRYDGDKFRVFRSIWGNDKSLGNNHITSLTEAGNKILIGTQKELDFYDYETSQFGAVNYQPLNGGQPQKINTTIFALTSTKEGKVYIATDYLGLLVFDGKMCSQVDLQNGNIPYSVQALTVGHNNLLWLFVKNVGLCSLAPGQNKVRIVNSQLQRATSLLEDAQKNIWVGTENNLFYYNVAQNKLDKMNSSYGALTSSNIVDLKFDKKGKLWIATNGGGLNILDEQKGKLSYIIPGKGTGTLHSGAIDGIFQDSEARMWIATLRGGVNIIDDKNKVFKWLTHDPFNANSVVNKFIISFCEDELHNVWIGTDGGGLSYWNTHTNKYESFEHTIDPASLSSNFVVSILKDFNNQIWIATFNGGIDLFDKTTQHFKHYTCYNTATKLEEKNLWKLFEDSHHNLWAGATRGGALFKYNPLVDKFELFDERLVNIHSLFEDRSGNLWAGNYTQLIKVDVNHKKHQYYNIGYAIRAIAQGEAGKLWIGTEGGGLLLYDIAKANYKRFTQIDGLPSNSILNILLDNRGNLWCSTYNGLSEYNSRTDKFKNYDSSDGLQSNQFNYNAALKLHSGDMLFGGINGFNLFTPDSVKIAVKRPQLRLTGLKINNVTTDGSSDYTNAKPIVCLKKITIPFDEATLAIDYTALEYSFPDKISYAYYLEGWDHGWNYVGQLKTAYYTRLNEGNYTLRIKATDTEGAWKGNELSIMIRVLPPWYRTWWAYFLYFATASGVVYWFWNYRVRQARLRNQIEVANVAVEREKELNEKKLSFFTNVSHEFRTPLTLIINPIKDLLDQNKDDTDELGVIYRNARRLLGLVDHLLLFRKTESENTQLKISRVNFVSLCREVYLCFSQQAKIKKLKYVFESVTSDMEVYADGEKLEIALFNLISNAIKFTPEGGNITIIVGEDERHVYFKITDNGIGINSDIGDKLFDKFYQVKNKNYFKTGFGIGLYLVKVFIKAHQGFINYHNNENGCGTTFVLTLQKGKQHFAPDQLFEELEFDLDHVNDLIDHDNKEVIVKEEDTNNLELLISNKQSILVIDDNSEIRAYIKRQFVLEYAVYEADSGKLGLELIRKYLPDLIISDIVMNEMDGLEVCKTIKEDSTISHIPIILLTGDATPELMLKSINEGAVDFLSKPFEREVLIARVKSVLRRKVELQNYFYKEITLKNNARNISEEHKDFLYKCIAVIESHITDDQFDVDYLSKQMGISYPTLFKRVKTITGQSVNNFMRFVRLRKAAEILIHTNCNVNEAALQVGFNDIKYFREHFNKQFGINPSDFVKKHRYRFQASYRIDQLNTNLTGKG